MIEKLKNCIGNIMREFPTSSLMPVTLCPSYMIIKEQFTKEKVLPPSEQLS